MLRLPCQTERRIIPAYAGSTDSSCSFRLRCLGSSPHTRGALPVICTSGLFDEDHPRIRGEHSMCGPRPVGSRGSSPHTRGARLRRGLRAARQGIIPAYAGSTVSLDVCRLMVPGSSPHTRGAPASKTPRCGSGRDHPRIRGEHQRAYPSPRGQARIIPAYAGSTDPSEAQVVRLIGSSPHTRGAL